MDRRQAPSVGRFYVLCGYYVSDLKKFTVQKAPRLYEGGDVFRLQRDSNTDFEMGVALGGGVDQKEAELNSNKYLRQLGKHDGVDMTAMEYPQV